MTNLLRVLPILFLFACPMPGPADGGTGGGFGGGTGASGGGSSGGGSGGGGGAVVALTFTEYCNTAPAALCDYAARCGLFDTRAGCEASLLASNLCDYAGPSVRDGRQSFDGTVAAQCFRDITSGCVQPATCGDFFTGQVALGQACFTSDDCVTGAWCDDSQMMCPGSCQPRQGAGSQVRNSQACLENLGATFTIFDGGLSFGYTCQPLRALGESCTGYGTCAAGLVCNTDTGSCETPRGPNVVCTLSDGGSGDGLCATNTFCQPMGAEFRCGPPGALGQACGQCRFDLRCTTQDGGARACAPLGLLDDSCTRTAECRSGLFCRPANGPFGPGTCRTPGVLGDSCTGADESCGTGLRCNQQAPTDGGFFPENRCGPSDGGTQSSGCFDPTP